MKASCRICRICRIVQSHRPSRGAGVAGVLHGGVRLVAHECEAGLVDVVVVAGK